MIATSGIDHIVLHVDNPQKSKKFYTEILGMTVYRPVAAITPCGKRSSHGWSMVWRGAIPAQ